MKKESSRQTCQAQIVEHIEQTHFYTPRNLAGAKHNLESVLRMISKFYLEEDELWLKNICNFCITPLISFNLNLGKESCPLIAALHFVISGLLKKHVQASSSTFCADKVFVQR